MCKSRSLIKDIMNSFPFDEARATQAAAWLLAKTEGGRMTVVKLSKLLYLVERKALERWGRPMIGGAYASMAHGPVISPVVDAMKPAGGRPPLPEWDHFLARKGNDIVLTDDPGSGRLHKAAINLLDEVFESFRWDNTWEVRDHTHTLPEYTDPGDSSLPIPLKKVLKVLQKPSGEIETVLQDANHLSEVAELTGC